VAASAISLILRYLLEEEDDDFKDLTQPSTDPVMMATSIYQHLVSTPFDGTDFLEMPGGMSVKLNGSRRHGKMIVTLTAPEREALNGTGAKAGVRQVFFTWPAKEQFFINTLARKIAYVMADEPRRERIEQLYHEVEALAGSPRYQEWYDAVQDEKVDGHTTDYGKMTMDDIDFWFAMVRKFQGNEH